ncbi:phage tail protein I [Pseudomonas aeruginosa]|uniref:phage tail protein I n=2 Tax=Pseudomonas aeruginosa TaxID=287 RepID=UPI00076D940D|nr:phage tail protein I [Pseudomonas aeruginosa]MBK1802854.1 phage tail protein I [Pseudomonas aeruginosa]MBM2530470.1 phage tail protein I [Pseudomonas aeruginosa]MCA6854763.1 phage tail protein I [Pseudomonas aeruginosa]HCI1729312.1 phage tail protein I [Pseudomonas aeruginosa]HCI1799714.1 phage tail protein I [Pseudomonas aeruginosa]
MSEENAPLVSLLPANRSALEEGLDLAFAQLLGRIEPPFPELMDPATTPAEFLPYLAADRGVGDWDPSAPESELRLTTALAWAIKRQAGTRRALVHAVESMELEALVTSWHETPAGVPYTFTVEATVGRPWLPGDFPRLWRRLNDAKSERDNLDLILVHETSGGLRAAAAAGTPLAIGDLDLAGALPDLDLRGELGGSGAAQHYTINDYDLEAQT